MTFEKFAPTSDLHPVDDAIAHEQTYRGFLAFAKIASVVVICWVLSLAVGGLKEAWGTALLGVIAASVAGTVAAVRPSTGMKALAAVAFALALLLLFK